MSNPTVDLKARAREAMLEAGFHPDFSPELLREAQAAGQKVQSLLPGQAKDMRNLAWSSIDNDNSRDLDQVEYVEKLPDGTLRLLVGIADVDALVPLGSLCDQHAAAETTSVYTDAIIFPMLPAELSTDETSLLNNQDRLALVIEMHIQTDGKVSCHDVYPALLRNHAKLAYNATGAWLEGRGPIPQAISGVPGMEAQIRLQLETSQKLLTVRKDNGSLAFETIETAADVGENGQIKNLVIAGRSVAEDIIESFMVAANVSMAEELKSEGALSIRRVVKVPKRWDRIQVIASQFGVKLPDVPNARALSDFLEQRKKADPVHFPDLSLSVIKMLGAGEYIVEHAGEEHEGHFGLAVQDYTHSTAPNRRYADLVTQRLIKAVANKQPAPYTEQQLGDIATHCTEREDASRKVERLMRKIVAANLLSNQIGQSFDGIITGASVKGTFVRLLKFPAEGMIVRGAQGLDVGDKVQVRLAGVNVVKGFVDFERK